MKTRLVLAIGVLAAAFAVGAQAVPTGNLLVNPGFEDTPAFAGWSTSHAALRNHNPAAHGGSNYVFGSNTPTFTVSQQIDLLASGFSAADIDAGNLGLEFGGWQTGYRGQDDYGRILVSLFDAANVQIGSASLTNQGSVSASTWVEQSGSTALLADTRVIQFSFTGTRVQGSNNDAYLDDAFLNVTQATTPPSTPVPEPSPFWLFAVGLAALGVARWRMA